MGQCWPQPEYVTPLSLSEAPRWTAEPGSDGPLGNVTLARKLHPFRTQNGEMISADGLCVTRGTSCAWYSPVQSCVRPRVPGGTR